MINFRLLVLQTRAEQDIANAWFESHAGLPIHKPNRARRSPMYRKYLRAYNKYLKRHETQIPRKDRGS